MKREEERFLSSELPPRKGRLLRKGRGDGRKEGKGEDSSAINPCLQEEKKIGGDLSNSPEGKAGKKKGGEGRRLYHLAVF